MNILLTGATGFVGQKLIDDLVARTDAQLRLAIRKKPSRDFCQRVTLTSIDDISANTNWQVVLEHCDVVIHAAARVHVMEEHADDPLAAYRETNVMGTLNLAQQSAHQGVKRFIYFSSIKVNGELTPNGKPFNADDEALPQCPYSISKYEAEQGLLALAEETGMEVVIIRPVLVYGPGVKGNFKTMMEWLQKGIPLPLGMVHNQRSFVSIDNLVDFVITCIEHPGAANQVFLVSDGDDLSTTVLLRKLRRLLDKKMVLVPIPVWALHRMAALAGKRVYAERLCGSLQVDIGKARELLNWQPVAKVDDALRATVDAYLCRDAV